jgi:DNA helicase-2/ATP-dependent DNA helicase PcrA
MDTLNAAQKQAVSRGDGAALVLAGAGSGKTRVIVERLAWLVDEKGVDSRQLLALTFTNRAAGEMRSRVAARLGVSRFGAWVGTFHSFGLYVLRRDFDKLGRSKTFTIVDDSDQLALIKRLIKEQSATAARVTPREALSWISAQKQELAEPVWDEPAEDAEEETCRALMKGYHDTLVRASAVDFDDLLVLTAKLLEDHEEVRDKYARRYHYIHIDEYQDTNRAQYRIARSLSAARGNLFVVGDEDQAIYSWRGADINNILDFSKDFPDAEVFRLEENYRSAAPILNVANAVVAHNTQRLGKTLFTNQGGGDPVRYYLAKDAEDEARFVVDEASKSGQPCAVLYRTNGQARLLEEALRKKGVAYVVVGGVQFYARKEVKDILAYLRLLVNPNDDVALRRIINLPTRGLGAVTMDKLNALAAQREMPLLQLLRDLEHDQSFTERVRKAVDGFVQLLDDLKLKAATSKVSDLVEAMLEATDYRDYVEQSDEKDFRTRLEIVDEFVSACTEYDERSGGDLLAFLQELALLSDVDGLDAEPPKVTLMTCHSAKGLEFDEVFLIGLEEGLLPHAVAAEEDEEVEEERRLCYVAMTRARKRLTLTSAESRVVYGERRVCEPSRFLGEIPANQLTAIAPKVGGGGRAKRTAAAPAAEPDAIKLGTRVRHATFGMGTVMFTRGRGAKLRARIRFETGRTREFMVSKAPLEVVKGGSR